MEAPQDGLSSRRSKERSEVLELQSDDAEARCSPKAIGAAIKDVVSMAGRDWSTLDERQSRTMGILACTGCVITGPTLVLVNNHILRRLHFNYPLLITSLGLAVSFAATRGLRAAGLLTPRPITWGFWLRKVVPVGALSACTLVTGNASYLFLSVSLIQVLKCLTPVFTLAVTSCFYPKGVSMRETCAVMLMTYGGSWALWSSLDDSLWRGVVIMLTSDLCEAFRSVAQQSLLQGQGSSVSLIELLYWFSPVACSFNLAGALTEEVPRLLSSGDLAIPAAHALAFALASVLGFFSNCLNFAAIQLTSALALKVLTTASNLCLIFVSTAWLGDILSGAQLTGYGLSLSGFVWYQAERHREAKATALRLDKEPPAVPLQEL